MSAFVSVSVVEIGRRECLYVVGRRCEVVGNMAVDAGLAAGGIVAVGSIAAAVGTAADAGLAIVADAAAVAVWSVVATVVEVLVMGCALLVVCRFALRRLVDC